MNAIQQRKVRDLTNLGYRFNDLSAKGDEIVVRASHRLLTGTTVTREIAQIDRDGNVNFED